MKPMFQKEKKIYLDTPIPETLPQKVRHAIHTASITNRKPKHLWMKTISGVAVACCAAFIVTVNASPIFAQSVSQIPVLNQLAKIVTFSTLQQQDQIKLIDAKIPELINTGNTELEKRINEQIKTKMDSLLTDSETIAQEYYDAFIETGGKAEEFHPVQIILDYEVKHSDENVVSFVITRFIGAFNAYTEHFYYNLNLETGKEITLEDVLGSNYIEIANTQIQQQIEEQMAAGTHFYFQDEEFQSDNVFHTIQKDQSFYLSEDGTPVIVFDKYEIAPGSEGFPEFPIQIPQH